MHTTTTMKRITCFCFVYLGSCRGDDYLHSLRRRLRGSIDDSVFRKLWEGKDEATDFAIENRHDEDPEERNVFVRIEPIPETPGPTPLEKSPSPSLQPSNSPSAEPSSIPSLEPSVAGGLGSRQPTSLPSLLPTVAPRIGTSSPSVSIMPTMPNATASPSLQPSESLPGGSPQPSPPIGQDTNMPTTSQAPTSDVAINAAYKSYLELSWTDNGALDDPSSPQFLAAAALSASNPSINASSIAGTDELDLRYGLNVLYFATDGPNWRNKTLWTSSDPPCGGVATNAWFGLTCELGSLLRIRMRENDLLGQLPSEIQALRQLSKCEISDGDSLKTILLVGYLRFCVFFTGTMDLTSNTLSGTIPGEIGGLSVLEELELGNNFLVETVPTQIGNLTSLKTLGLFFNFFTGPIPSEIGNLVNLEALIVENNSFSGSIPSEIGSLASLGTFYQLQDGIHHVKTKLTSCFHQSFY